MEINKHTNLLNMFGDIDVMKCSKTIAPLQFSFSGSCIFRFFEGNACKKKILWSLVCLAFIVVVVYFGQVIPKWLRKMNFKIQFYKTKAPNGQEWTKFRHQILKWSTRQKVNKTQWLTLNRASFFAFSVRYHLEGELTRYNKKKPILFIHIYI